MTASKRIAVVLFNLGGPDSPDAVEPFLFNLFNDKAIIGVPQPIRWLLAKLISKRRAPVAKDIYDAIGGRSPIVPLTQQQAAALEKLLNENSDWNAEVFVSMRYWHPRAEQVALDVATFEPDQVVLLPLYPQFSTTTTLSSLKEWARAAKQADIAAPTASICCHPTQRDFIQSHVTLLKEALATSDKSAGEGVRVLFSAHGLPKKIVEAGDPYQWQVEQTAAAVVEALGMQELDHVICYQSRVGPLEWIGPSTDDEIRRAGAERTSLIVVPIAFVSEHSETLVELDMEFRALAEASGVPSYVRVGALGAQTDFIKALASLVEQAVDQETGLFTGDRTARICPSAYGQCPLELAAVSEREHR